MYLVLQGRKSFYERIDGTNGKPDYYDTNLVAIGPPIYIHFNMYPSKQFYFPYVTNSKDNYNDNIKINAAQHTITIVE